VSYRQEIDVTIKGINKINDLENKLAAAERNANGLQQAINNVNDTLSNLASAGGRAASNLGTATKRFGITARAAKGSTAAERLAAGGSVDARKERAARFQALREASADVQEKRQFLSQIIGRARTAKRTLGTLTDKLVREQQAILDNMPGGKAYDEVEQQISSNINRARQNSRRARTTTMIERRTTRVARLDQTGNRGLNPNSPLGRRTTAITSQVSDINEFLGQIEKLRERVAKTKTPTTSRRLQNIENLRSALSAELGSLAEGLAEIERITSGRRKVFNSGRTLINRADTLVQTGEIPDGKKKSVVREVRRANELANTENIEAAREVLARVKNTLDAETQRIAANKQIAAYQDKQYRAQVIGPNTSLLDPQAKTREMFKYEEEQRQNARDRKKLFNSGRVLGESSQFLLEAGQIDNPKRQAVRRNVTKVNELANQGRISEAKDLLEATKNTVAAQQREYATTQKLARLEQQRYKAQKLGPATELGGGAQLKEMIAYEERINKLTADYSDKAFIADIRTRRWIDSMSGSRDVQAVVEYMDDIGDQFAELNRIGKSWLDTWDKTLDRTLYVKKNQQAIADLMTGAEKKILSGKTLNPKELEAWTKGSTAKMLPPAAGYAFGQPLPRNALLPTGGARLVGQSREFLTNSAGRRTYIPELDRLSIARSLPSSKPAAIDKQASTEKLLKNLKNGINVSMSEAEKLTGGMYRALPDEKILNAAARGIKQLTTNQQEFNQSVESGTRFQQKFREEQERLAKIYGTPTPIGTSAPGGKSPGRQGAKTKEVESLTSILGGLSTSDASAKVFRGGRSADSAARQIVSSFNSATGQSVGSNGAQSGLRDLGKLSRATSVQLEILQKAISTTRDGMKMTDRQFREMTRTLAKVEDQQARRDPGADFLTRKLGTRGGAAVSEGLIGGAFPLLFGQGLGASAGGLVGGAAGGAAGGMLGFGLSLIGTSIGAVVDTTVQNLKDLAAGLRSPNDAITALEASGITVSRTLKFQVEQLQSVGRAYDAQTLVLQEVQKRLGPDGVRNLVALEAEQKKLEEQWSSIAGTIQGQLLPALVGFTQFINGFLEVARAAANDPVIGKLLAISGKSLAAAIPGAPAVITATELAAKQGRATASGIASDVRPGRNIDEMFADETARIQESRRIADEIKSAYREAFNLQREAYDLQRAGADLNRDIADYSYKKQREIFDLRQQAAEGALTNNRAAAQNRIERSDLNARETFAAAVGFEQQLLSNVREAMRTRKEGEADIELSRRKLELTLAKLNRDVEDYKRTTAREVEDIERRKLAYARSVEDYKMKVADYVLEQSRKAADLMRQAMTLPDMGGAGGASGGLASAIDRLGGAYQFRSRDTSNAYINKIGFSNIYQSDPRENKFFDQRPALITGAKARIASLTQKDLAALAFTVLTEAGGTDIGKLDVAGNMLIRSANLGNAAISAVAKQPGQYSGVNGYSRNDLESEARGRQVFGSRYDQTLSMLRGGMGAGGGMSGGMRLPGSISGRLDASGQNGADMPVGAGNSILSYHSGVVSEISKAGNNGNYAVIKFIDDLGNSLEATYSHMAAIVGVGQRVMAGQVIGRYDGSGRTSGPHNSIDINSPGTNGALQRNAETAAARRSADILVTGRAQGMAGSSIQAMGATQLGATPVPQFSETNIGPTPAAAPLNKDRLSVLTSLTGNEKDAQKILEDQIKLKQKGIDIGQLERILQDNQLPQLQQQNSALQGQLEARKRILDLSDNAASVADIEAEASARLAQIEKDRANAIAKVQKEYKGDAESINLINKQAKVAIDIAKKEEEQRKKNLELSNQLQGVERARTEIIQLQEEIAVGKAEAAALELGKLQASNVELLKASLLYKQATDEQRKLLEKLKGQREQQAKINELQAEYNNKLEDTRTRIAEVFAGTNGLTEYQRALREIAAKGIKMDSGEADKILQTAKAVDALAQKLRQLERIRDVAAAWTDSFIGFNAELLKTGNLADALTKWGEDVSSRAIDMLLEITMRPIQDQIFNSLAKFLGFEKPEDPMIAPLASMDTNVQGIRQDVATIKDGIVGKVPPAADPVPQATAANSIQLYTPSNTTESGNMWSTASLQAASDDATAKLQGFSANVLLTSDVANDVSNSFAKTIEAGDTVISSAVTASEEGAAKIKTAYGNRIATEEDNVSKLQMVGQKLGTGIQILGGIAMGVAGFQQIKKGGTYNTLMGLAGIFGAISQTSFGFGKLFGLKGFASGGRPPLDRPSWVGENGPEMWWPDRAGTIVPMDQLYTPGDPLRGGSEDATTAKFAATRASLESQQASMQSREPAMFIPELPPIKVQSDSNIINQVEYVTKDEHERGMKETAKMGQALTIQALQSSVQTRKRVGM
jgi:hypothetical protein